MSELKIVVIGGVACGPKAAAKAKRCDPNAQVTLIEKGEWISYGGCGLPYYLGATVKDLNDLMTTSWEAVRTPEFMKDTKDIDTLLGWEATKINRAEKTVEVKEVKTGEIKVLPYDKLVIATGADNFKPPMEGIDATGVFGMKTPKDAEDKNVLLNIEVNIASEDEELKYTTKDVQKVYQSVIKKIVKDYKDSEKRAELLQARYEEVLQYEKEQAILKKEADAVKRKEMMKKHHYLLIPHF